MGNHRADVDAERRLPQATPSEPTSYTGAGKRRAQQATESTAIENPRISTPAASYEGAGKRRAAVVREVQTSEPAPVAAAPTRALVETAAPERHEPEIVPAPRRPAVAPAVLAVGRDLGDTYDLSDSLRPLFAEDTRTDLPRIDLDALELALEGVADFTGETTAKLPRVSSGKRRARRAKTARGRRFRGFPTVPVIAGAAAIAVAGGGAISAAHYQVGPTITRVVAASPFSGATDAGSVGIRTDDSVSRNSDRAVLADQAESAAKERTQTLTELDAKATGQDQWLSTNQWTTPITEGYYELTGRFGDVSGLWSSGVHTGLDFAAPYGTPIHAVASGVITSTGYEGSYGNLTVETLPDGTELWYAHQSSFGVSVGQHVGEGQAIGYVGSTGNTTGAHVHLEVRPGGGDPVDPDAALRAHGVDPDAHQG
jgi:murein DD-endopeptidase MepM/ murein hydrolase activator NlpD